MILLLSATEMQKDRLKMCVVCFNNLFQRNKLDTNSIKYNYHIMIIQHNNVLLHYLWIYIFLSLLKLNRKFLIKIEFKNILLITLIQKKTPHLHIRGFYKLFVAIYHIIISYQIMLESYCDIEIEKNTRVILIIVVRYHFSNEKSCDRIAKIKT